MALSEGLRRTENVVLSCVTALAKVTVGVLITVVPPAPAVADPMLTTVVDPAAPPIPRFRVLVTPEGLIPVPIP
jgi:hypothetical protein